MGQGGFVKGKGEEKATKDFFPARIKLIGGSCDKGKDILLNVILHNLAFVIHVRNFNLQLYENDIKR